MYIPRVSAETITVSGAGADANTAITLPSTFTPTDGCIYDILIRTQVPAGTDGTYITIAGDPLMKMFGGNYARSRGLGWRKVLRVQYCSDPAHYNLIAVRG